MEQQINGVDASADGKRNAYSFACSVVGYRPNFSVCLHLMTQRKLGRLNVNYATCSAAIGNKTCPAIKMRKEELDKGQAIYFVERVRSGVVINPTATPTLKRDNKSSVTKREKQTVSKPDLPVDSGGIADAINNAFVAEKESVEAAKKEAVETKQPVITAQQGVTPLPGESLLDMAKRIMKIKQGATA
jgi:hypothetical protein